MMLVLRKQRVQDQGGTASSGSCWKGIQSRAGAVRGPPVRFLRPTLLTRPGGLDALYGPLAHPSFAPPTWSVDLVIGLNHATLAIYGSPLVQAGEGLRLDRKPVSDTVVLGLPSFVVRGAELDNR